MEPTKITKREYEMLASFRFALRQFLRFSEEAAQAAGTTPQQYLALLAIKGFPGREHASVGELADRLQIQHHSAVGLADRLEGEGLLARKPCLEDRRQVLLHLTPRGGELLEQLASVHREQLRRIGPELQQLLALLSGTGGGAGRKKTCR